MLSNHARHALSHASHKSAKDELMGRIQDIGRGTFRFAKHGLGWDKAALRYPEQVTRWTWLIIAALTMLRLARPVADDHKQRWERRRPPGRLTPGRVRRDFCRLAALTGTPARPPKNTRPGPGRPKGRTSTPATRYPVITKAA